MNNSILTLQKIYKAFSQAHEKLVILDSLSLNIGAGEVVALVGPSGSGKTTLLQIAGLLAKPDSGSVVIAGQDYSTASEAESTLARRNNIGFIYQFHHLLPELSALENVMMPQLIAGKHHQEAGEYAAELLDKVKLSHRKTHRPSELSGGEKQRVAIARALANKPKLVLADEPTGNLDPETSAEVFAAFADAIASSGAGALVATHNMELARQMARTLRLNHGSCE
jgi:lipoprotein-releasing system ATP-binding protein